MKSNNKQFEFPLSCYGEYGLELENEREMLVLLNILEANQETLEDIGGFTCQALAVMDGDATRADIARHYLVCNAFYECEEEYLLFLVQGGQTTEEAVESFQEELKFGNVVRTSDGIVALNIV